MTRAPIPPSGLRSILSRDPGASIGSRLTRGFALVVAVALLALAVSLVAMRLSSASWSEAAAWSDATKGAGQRIESALRERSAQAAYAATGDTRFKDEFDAADAIGEEADSYLRSVDDAEFASLVAAAEANDEKHDSALDSLFGLIEAGAPQPEIAEALKQADALVMVEYETSLKIQGRIDTLRTAAIDDARGRELFGLLAGLLVALVAVVAAAVIGRRIIGGVRRPVAALVAACERAGRGDLTSRFPEDGPSEIAGVGSALNAMTGSIAALVRDLRGTATSLSGTSQQLAASAEETGRAVAEVTRAVTDAAHGSERQVVLATTVKEASTASRRAVDDGVASSDEIARAMEGVREASQEVVAVIGDLDQRSDRIGGIIQTITDIAEQTNLLALNAAIEAARAGDLGRGFAVVADEVRKLAEESQTAASSIAGIVEEIRAATLRAVEVAQVGATRVDAGSAIVGDTNAAFERIAAETSAVDEALEQVTEVASGQSAVNEQLSAIAQETSASSTIVAEEAQRIAETAAGLERALERFTV